MASTRGVPALKKLDRYIGIPLLAPFALARKRSMPPRDRVRRIGLMKTAAIGDTLLLAGLLEDARRAFPAATLVMIVGPDNQGVAELLSANVDEVLVVSPRAPLAAARSVRAARLDVIVDFGSWPRFDAMLAAVSGASARIGFRTPKQHRHFAYDLIVEHSRELHERDNYVRLLQAIGVSVASEPSIEIDGPPPPVLAELEGAPYAVFHPWSGGYMHQVKEWPSHRWVELARRLAERKWAVVLTGSGAASVQSVALAERIAATGARVLDAAGRLSLREVAVVGTGAQVVVSVNTGIAHLAALAGARVVTLEGPTPVHRWRPLGPAVRTVATTFAGCGYLNLGFEYAGQRLDCMCGITVDAVVQTIAELSLCPVPDRPEGRATSLGAAGA